MMTNCPQLGVIRFMLPISTFWGPCHIFEADYVRHVKIGVHTLRNVTLTIIRL